MTASDPLTAVLNIGGKLIDRWFPDPAEKAAAQVQLLQMAQAGELAQLQADVTLATGQMEINKVEAASTRLFVAGWRPAIGWICGAAMGFKYIGGPLLEMACHALNLSVQMPQIDATELLPILGALLGLGAMRTAEKVKGAA